MSKDDKFGKDFLDELEALSNSAEKKTKKPNAADEVENLLKSTLSEVGIDADKLRASVKAMETEKKKEKDEMSRLDSILEPVRKPIPGPVREHVREPARETAHGTVRETAHGTVHDVLRETVHEPLIEPLRDREPRPPKPPERVEIFEKPKPTERDIFPPLPDKKPAGPRTEPSLQRERFEAPRKKPEGVLFDSFAEKPKKKFPVAAVILAAVVVIGGSTAAFMFLKGGKGGSAPANSSLLAQNPAQPSNSSSEPTLGQNLPTSDSGQPATKQATEPNAKPSGIAANNQRNAAAVPGGNQGTTGGNAQGIQPADTQPAPTETFQPLVPTQTPRVQDIKPTAVQAAPAGGQGAAPAAQPADNQPKKAKTGDLIPLEQVDAQPAVIQKIEAIYPSMAQRMGIEGTVIVNALVSESGDVIRTAILRKSSSSTNFGFEAASEQAVRQWKFKPAVKDGVNVKTWKPVALVFKK